MQSIKVPAFGEPVPAAHPSADLMRALRLRRSTSPDLLGPPGPSPDEIRVILEIAARVPDHRRVFPFRFIVFEGAARAEAGDILAAAFAAAEPAAAQARIDAERGRFLRAPFVVCVVSAVDPGHKTPEWEQILCAGAVCQNLLLAASAHGFGASWLTEWYGYDRGVLDKFGLKPSERVAGFVYVGTAREQPKERLRPDLDALIAKFGA